jgi:hypothetical protein
MGQPDIQIHIGQTLLAGENLEASAKRIKSYVENFANALEHQMDSGHWSGPTKTAAVEKLRSLIATFDDLTSKCHETGRVIGEVARHMDATERRNLARFTEMGELPR